MFPSGVQSPWGVALPQKRLQVPKAQKWQYMLPDMVNQIQGKVSDGWDVIYCDCSRKETSGLSHAGYRVCSDPRTEEGPVPASGHQTITHEVLYLC